MPTFRTRLAQDLRRNMNETECRLWDRLRARQLGGWKFRRQHPIGLYFVDFYCPAVRLVVEINGRIREWAYDAWLTASLEAQDYTVMHIDAADIDEDLDGVIAWIYGELLELGGATPRHRRVSLPQGLGECAS